MHTVPSAFGSHSFPPGEVLWFWLVLLVCPASPIVWVLLCPFRRATFIGWCPLEPPRWSLGGVRRRGGALLVLLFLLLDLLNDLADPPLCSLKMKRWKKLPRHNDSESAPIFITYLARLLKKWDTKSVRMSSTIEIIWSFVCPTSQLITFVTDQTHDPKHTSIHLLPWFPLFTTIQLKNTFDAF